MTRACIIDGMASPKPAVLVSKWRDMQSAYVTLSTALERELEAGYDIGLSEYEILDLVSEVDDGNCRMKDLGSLSPMSQSALSKIVDRLQRAGLLERSSCDDDRRALLVSLTDKGRDLHAQASGTYLGLIGEHLDR